MDKLDGCGPSRESARVEPPHERPLTLCVHIPKCAGSTVEGFLLDRFPTRTLRPRRRAAPHRYVGRYYTADDVSPDTDFVIGHNFGVSIRDHFPGRPVRAAVLMRDPVDLILSHYNYRMARYQDEGYRKLIPFELWYRSRPRNFISEYLLHRYLEIPLPQLHCMSDRTRFEAADELLRSFWHVGRHDQCHALIERIARDFDVPSTHGRMNTTKRYVLQLDDISAGLREKIERDHQVDRALFGRFCQPDQTPAAVLGTGCLHNLLKDLWRPSSVIGYRLTRSNRVPGWIASRPNSDGRGFLAKHAIIFGLLFIITAYCAWTNDLIPDGANFGWADDAAVTAGLGFLTSILLVL